MDARKSIETPPLPRSDAEMLEAVESFLREGRAILKFPSWLETKFDVDTRARYLRWLKSDTLKTAAIYNVFLIGDFFLARDMLGVAAGLHFLVVTPAMLAIAWLFTRKPRRLWRDVASATLPILMTLQILAVYIGSREATSPHYLYFVLMTAICANTALRLNYRSARWASATIFVLLAATLAFTDRMPAGVALMQCISLAVCARVTLNGNFDRERDLRRAYLHALRDRLRVSTTDAEARRDALTGVANRRRLDEVGAAMWTRESDEVSPVCVILFDVDHFKLFNDIHGHQAGDACLKRIAACAASELRGIDDFVARYGGEEFLALLPRTPLAQGVEIAERLRVAIAGLQIPHEGAEELGVATASFGVAASETAECSFEALTAAADAALYVAKRAGRNRVAAPPTAGRIQRTQAA